jgi:glycosyltransferase involved in cell wall biosynthesis
MSSESRKISIVIPVFNEEATLRAIVDAVLAVDLGDIEKELVIIDDCSTDGSRAILDELAAEHGNISAHSHDKNQGKGAALQTGFKQCTGDWILIQDADLEYDPEEYPKLLEPILADKADVVHGSRFVSHGARRVVYYWHSVGNKLLTTLSNIFSNINLTDIETCYKVFDRAILSTITIEEKRFGFEPEITAKIAKTKCRIYEVGISYYGRTYQEGKKIGWKDGVRALWCIVKYNLFR